MAEQQTSLEEGAAPEEVVAETTEEQTAELSTTEATTTETTDESEVVADAWGDDWRQKYAGDDEKMAKRLERYSSPKSVLDALVAAQNKISSGELKSTLPPDATDEEKAAWRLDNGIPDTPDGYEIQLADGMVLGEADQPIVKDFLESAHAANMRPDQVNQNLQWYMNFKEQAEQVQMAEDEAYKETSIDELRNEWGNDYRTNVQISQNLIDQLPNGIGNKMLAARGPDGKLLGANPDFLRAMADLSRQINPVATLVPGSGTNPMQAIESEIAQLREMSADRSKSSKYWFGPEAQKNQERYAELLEAQKKHG